MTSRQIETAAVTPASVETLLFRYPVETPVRTSFGVMHDRPALFVRVTDADGTVGWGEVWCNFPTVGAEHRARLIETALAPRMIGRLFETPAAAFEDLTEAMAVLAIQTGEHGPLAQCIAGIDIALWDLSARKMKQPLWRLLGGSSSKIAAYASGLNPDQPEKLATQKQREGHRSFKLKVGFGSDRDTANLRAMRAARSSDSKTEGGFQLTIERATPTLGRMPRLALSKEV